ncbi:hypothetical protein N0V84_005823 [Fusarium piperis]|uniref:Uncharacterized protein n=1 Tax=Fusarium piperis TaxID=1435070 RepID=A0A9W8WDB3_9HYPO|nr:hypothetical protein N0V84_005823 [Fusarium piperis]
MRPKAGRNEAESGEQLPARIIDRYIQQVGFRLKETITKLQGRKESALSELDEKVKAIISETTPDSRDEVRRALEAIQNFTQQHVETVAEGAIDFLRRDSQFFQEVVIEMDAELGEQHEEAMTELEKKLANVQQTEAVSGEPTTKSHADRVAGSTPNMSARPSRSSSSVHGFAETFGGANRPRRAAAESSRRPPRSTPRGSSKSSQSQSKDLASLWGRGEGALDGVDSQETKSESTPKTGVPLEPEELEPKEAESTDYEHLDPMMRSLLEAGEDLQQEFMNDAGKAGTEEWQGEADEYGDLQQQLDKALLQSSKQQRMMNHKDELIQGLHLEIAKLKTNNNSLEASLEAMAQAPSAAAAGTPHTGQVSRLASVTSFPVNSAGGSPRATYPAWVTAWLPNAVQVQMERVRVAVDRCVTEETACSEKMAKLGGGRRTIMEKDCLTARKSSSEDHRRDFTHAMTFLGELAKYSRKSQSCLADELSGMELGSSASELESATTLKKMPTPDPSSTGSETPKAVDSKKLASESGSASTQAQDASTSPKEPASPPKAASPAAETHSSSKSPKDQGTAPKVSSPLTEVHAPLASSNAPTKNTPPTSNTRSPEGNSEPVKELDDPESATQVMAKAIDSGVLRVWTVFAYLGLIATLHGGAWVRVCKFLFQVIVYVMNHVSRVIRLIRSFGRDTDKLPAPTFPEMPSPECLMIVMYHCVAFATFQVYMACSRERNIWFEANGVTRKYGLERSRNQKRWLFHGVDGNLVVGRKDVVNFFKLIYMLGMATAASVWSSIGQGLRWVKSIP